MARISPGFALLVVALRLPAQASGEEFVWQESWTCGGRIEITVVIAVQQPSGWIGIPIEASNWLQGAYIVRRGGRARLFPMHSVEGPGHEYQILRTDDGFASVNADPSGRGALLGFAEGVWRDARARELREEYPSESFWYEYRTADGGKSWSGPVRVPQHPGRVVGIYSALEQGGSLRALYADLERSAGR